MKRPVMLPALPACQMCGEPGATWDGPTKLGPWAYMCSGCLRWHGRPESSLNTPLAVED